MSQISTGSRLNWGLLLRWSWRDLKARWVQVAAIALVIALGTGSYAGLSSLTNWREDSTGSAYELLKLHDLRIELAQGSTVPQGALLAAVEKLGGVEAAEERLVAPIQVDASTGSRAILVRGVLIGVPVGEDGQQVDALYAYDGRALEPADVGTAVAMLEVHFAEYYLLPAEGTVRISGEQEVQYVGTALTPEYFTVTTDRGEFLAEANFAAVFTSLESAQMLAGKAGEVNDLVLRLEPGSDREAKRTELETLLAAELPGVGTIVTTREEDPAYALSQADIEGDQQIYDIFAALIFAGAVVAAFNLVTRIVESQRREIGVAMVLGVPPSRIAIRPLLVGAEIALLGVIFGVGVGVLIGQAMANVLEDLAPLPEWKTGFQPQVFLLVAVAGFLLPFLATMWPVWRAVSVPPVRAIQAGYRAARGGGLAPIFRWVRFPGNTFWQVPVRNVVRAPRRALLTSIGIAAAIAALVSFVGLIDSFLATIDRGNDEILWVNPDRLEVDLDRPYPATSPVVAAIEEAQSIGGAEAQLRLGATAIGEDKEIGLQIRVLALDNPVWTPKFSAGETERERLGIYLSELAARNLGVGVGDSLTVRHPVLEPTGTFALVETDLEVLGLHPHPYRFIAYMDYNHAGLFGLAGMANLLEVVPAEGATRDDVKRELFPMAGVTAAQGVSEISEALDELLNEFIVILRVIEGALLLLAVLIAFNSASINMDERARENATMFAFGVRVRTVLRMAIVENLILGVVATVAGVVLGWILLGAIIELRIPSTLPDIDVVPTISATTLALSGLLGVLGVALAPVLTVRKMLRMNVPATLKVME